MSAIPFHLTAALVQGPEFDLEGLIQIAVLVMFFILPAIRGVLKSKQKRELVRPGEDEATGPVMDEDQQRRAREQWERLLRGEQPEETRHDDLPVDSEPVPEVLREEPRPVPRPAGRRVASKALPSELSLELPVREPVPAPAVVEAAPLGQLAGREALVGTLALRAARSIPGPALRRPFAAGGVAWRRAIVLSEILGPPLALRERASWQGRR